jgi:hypothetical protein
VSAILVQEIIPLEYSLVIAAGKYQLQCVLNESIVSDMERVSSKFNKLPSINWARILKELNFAEIICGCKDCAVSAAISSIDISAIRNREIFHPQATRGWNSKLTKFHFVTPSTSGVVDLLSYRRTELKRCAV